MDNLFNLIQALGKSIGNTITIRQLSIDSKVPYTTALRLINTYPFLFTIEKKGNIKLVSLNPSDDIVKNYLIISERATTESFIKKNPQIRILKNDLLKGRYCAILFGSRAKGTHREKSDIDICIINKNGEKNVRFSKFEMLFKLEINPIYFSDHEFITMLSEKEQNVGKEIANNHIILYGEQYFWDMHWKNGIQKK